jgi:hypothetical protein
MVLETPSQEIVMSKRHAAAMCITALFLGACGAGEAREPTESPATQSRTQALYPEYNPDVHCLVSSQYVACNSGPTMYAYYSPEWGYYIERDVCGRNGPVICPYY